jgi:colanic acid biosynthesis glycosyl transferase WcaI
MFRVNEKKLRILFLTQIFDPEPALKGVSFVQALQGAGHSVQVLTTFPNYPGGKLYTGYRMRPWRSEVVQGVPVTRVLHFPSHDLSGLRRAWHFLSFFITSFIYVVLNGYKFDVVYVGHPGITTGLAARFGGFFWRLPYVLEIQDLWPDCLVASGLPNSSGLARWATPVCNFVYAGALRIVAQSKGMARVIAERGADKAKIITIYNWAADAPEHALPKSQSNVFPIVYAGNMGLSQNLEVAVEAASMVSSISPKIELWLVGGGVELEKLKAMVATRRIPNVRVLGRLPAPEFLKTLSEAKVMLLHLSRRPLHEITIPSKSQFYMAAGKPVLAAVAGEMAEIMDQSGSALVIPPGDAQQMADAMLTLAALPDGKLEAMGRAGRESYDARFAFNHAIEQTLEVLKQI